MTRHRTTSHPSSTHNQARAASERTRMPSVCEGLQPSFWPLVFKWAFLAGGVPDAFRNRFGRGRPFQILRVDALNSRLHRIKHAPHQRGPGCQVFEKVFSLPFGHWSSSGGFPAGGMRSGCVLDQVRQGLAFSDIKG